MISGYKIIDLKGVNITASNKTISGIYSQIESTKKPIIFVNVSISGTAYTPISIKLSKTGNTYYSVINETPTRVHLLSITSNDVVKITTTNLQVQA